MPSDSDPPTPRISSGTYRAFQDDARAAMRALEANRVVLEARGTGLAVRLIEQLEALADEFGTYEPDPAKRKDRVDRFYSLQERVALYLGGDR